MRLASYKQPLNNHALLNTLTTLSLYFLISRVLLNQIQHSSLSNVIISLFGKNTLIQLLLASN